MVNKTDKGDSVVVLPTAMYLELAYDHLYDNQTYQLLIYDPTKDIVKQFTEYLNIYKERK